MIYIPITYIHTYITMRCIQIECKIEMSKIRLLMHRTFSQSDLIDHNWEIHFSVRKTKTCEDILYLLQSHCERMR